MHIIPGISSLNDKLRECLEEENLFHCYWGHGDGYGVSHYTHEIFYEKETSYKLFLFWWEIKSISRKKIATILQEPLSKEEENLTNVKIETGPYVIKCNEDITKNVFNSLKKALLNFEDKTSLVVTLIKN